MLARRLAWARRHYETMAGKRKAGDVDVIDGVSFTRGSGNVYADLGFANAEEWQTKATLAQEIAFHCKGLKQREIAELLEIDQPKVSGLHTGQFQQFSTERLITFLRRAGQDVEIHVLPRKRGRTLRKKPKLGRLVVVSEAYTVARPPVRRVAERARGTRSTS
jgi:predicted XRE-type DNA-binding protein